MTEPAKIKEIYLFPIKSFPGIKLNKATVTKLGISHPSNPDIVDRKWMIVDDSGSFKTMRQYPKLALMKLSLNSENDHFIFEYPNKGSIKVPVNPPNPTRKPCRVWNLAIDGYSYGGEVSRWINEVLETDNLDLVVFKHDLAARQCKDINESGNMARENDFVIYEDYSPFMLMSESSLDELNKRLEKKVSMRNFRPNFVVENCEPFAEDDWDHFSIGNVKFQKIKHCSRCLLTTVDPDLGERNAKQEPLLTLREFRLNKDLYGNSPMLGINFACDGDSCQGATIQVGDEIRN